MIAGIRKKMNNRSGFTTVELMAATAVLLLIVLGMTAGITLGNRQYQAAMENSKAQELYMTLRTILTNELRYTNEVELSGDRVERFYSITYAVHDDLTALTALESDSDRESSSGHGELALGSGGEYNRLLGSASYSDGLSAAADIRFEESNGHFTVHLAVYGHDQSTVIADESFMVRGLNPITVRR